MRTREQFEFLPSWAWAALLDISDLFVNAISLALTATGILAFAGLAIDTAWDVVQTILAVVIFENSYAVLNVDFILPQGFDLFPTYTLLNILIKDD